MKAVCIDAFGGADVLSIRDVPTPVPEEGEFLIKVHAAGVNPEDCQKRTGELARVDGLFPLTLGRDVSGVVVSAGEYTTGFNPGDVPVVIVEIKVLHFADDSVARPQRAAFHLFRVSQHDEPPRLGCTIAQNVRTGYGRPA